MKGIKLEDAVARIPDGASLMVGGFMGVGTSERIMDELVPQGTLAERVRAGGFGLGGILTRTGLGTAVEAGKTRIEVNGEPFLLETPLRADFAIVHAKQADYACNLPIR
nr:CoA-transferase [Skermanella rosea]